MIEIKNLTKKYDKKTIFENFSCVLDNNIIGIMGPSGCGKTTLLKIIAGLEKYDSGEIIGKTDNISFVFQDDVIVSSLSPIKNIQCAIGKDKTKNEIINSLYSLGLKEYINKPCSELSGGMKRRVAIARAMLKKSDLILMDEPFKGLDDNTKNDVIQYVKDNIESRDLIVITHDEEELKTLNAKIINL